MRERQVRVGCWRLAEMLYAASSKATEKSRLGSSPKYGTLAARAGAYRPQAPSSATAHTLRRIVDLPAMLGPVSSAMPCSQPGRQADSSVEQGEPVGGRRF